MIKQALAVLLSVLVFAAAKKGGKKPKETVNPNIYNPGAPAPEHNGEAGKLFEGDILRKSGDHENDRNAIGSNSDLWPYGIVPYTIHSNVGRNLKRFFYQAIQDFDDMTCIRWVPKDQANVDHDDYVQIQSYNERNDPDGEGGCYSTIGRAFCKNGKNGSCGKQPLNLENERFCGTKGVVIHEMLHALGFWHEHSRTDRDKYVTIRYENIEKGMAPQFEKAPVKDENTQGFPYDYDSVMHYAGNLFSRRRDLLTIQTKDRSKQSKIGLQLGFSYQDIEEVNKLYGCKK